MKTRSFLPYLFIATVITVAFVFPKRFSDEMPQSGGDDLMSLIFADARAVLGQSLVRVTDRYYHGGVSIDYTAHKHECGGLGSRAHTHNHDPAGAAHADTVESTGNSQNPKHEPSKRKFNDPWAWMNSKIHVQQVRHLEHDEIAELIPSIWAACRADPQNIEAYEMGWYIIAKMLKRPEDGMKVLLEGIKNNPDSVALEVTRGQSLYYDMKDNLAAEEVFEKAIHKAAIKTDDDFKRLSVDEIFMLQRAFDYLRHFATEREDMDAAEKYAGRHEEVRRLIQTK
ncbi:MAG: hypothetical protein GX804_08535 [Lentisphaerae bacterium]|jgi:tetratricopeptide (TPR) repeat protein|nr:hypothetical protein [Lentisphaerota bacterium]